MTDDPLERLADAFVEDILSMSDEEIILEEQREEDLIAEWCLMIYGYTSPHWNRLRMRLDELRAMMPPAIDDHVPF
jgi:hypothetical protein